MTAPYLSVVMPAYNEEATIAESIRRIRAFMSLKNWDWELIISDDGSTDRTAEVIRERIAGGWPIRLLSSDRNHGKGWVCRSGIKESHGRYILLTDADLSTPIKEVDKLLAALDAGADVAIGSRARRETGADVQQTFNRRLAGRIFNLFVHALVIRGIGDTQCGFKCFRREVAQDIFFSQKLEGFSFDVEILYLAHCKGYRIKEVPVMWRQAKTSRVRLVQDAVAMVKELLALRKIYSIRRPVRLDN